MVRITWIIKVVATSVDGGNTNVCPGCHEALRSHCSVVFVCTSKKIL